jgi:hypothetical protein
MAGYRLRVELDKLHRYHLELQDMKLPMNVASAHRKIATQERLILSLV